MKKVGVFQNGNDDDNVVVELDHGFCLLLEVSSYYAQG